MFNPTIARQVIPPSVFTAIADRYRVPITFAERALLSSTKGVKSFTQGIPAYMVMSIGEILAPLSGSPLAHRADEAIHFIFYLAQIKRNVDTRLQRELLVFYEHYYDEAYSEAIGSDEGYRHYIAQVQSHIALVEICIYNAIYFLTMRGMYKQDFFFPYEYIKKIDHDSAVFARVDHAVLTDDDLF